MEISSGEEIYLDVRYISSELLVKRLVDRSAAEEVQKQIEDYAKISRAGPQGGTVEHNIGKWALSLSKIFFPVTKLQLKILELENQEIKSTICALNKNLSEAKKMLADNQPLVSSGTQLSKLKSISKRPSSLAEDRFYAMAQSVIPKSSPRQTILEVY